MLTPLVSAAGLKRREGVIHQDFKGGLEPVAGEWRIGDSLSQVAPVCLGTAMEGRVAHLVEALAFVIGNGLTRAVRLTWRLNPDVGIEASGRAGLWARANATVLFAPVAPMHPPVDLRLRDKGVEVR